MLYVSGKPLLLGNTTGLCWTTLPNELRHLSLPTHEKGSFWFQVRYISSFLPTYPCACMCVSCVCVSSLFPFNAMLVILHLQWLLYKRPRLLENYIATTAILVISTIKMSSVMLGMSWRLARNVRKSKTIVLEIVISLHARDIELLRYHFLTKWRYQIFKDFL